MKVFQTKLLLILTLLILFIAGTPVSVFAGDNGFKGEYFNNADLSGTPVFVRTDSSISFDWRSGSPDPAIASENFSVRWTRDDTFKAGIYRFSIISDDGSRLYIDNKLVSDDWKLHSAAGHSIDQNMTEGVHNIKLEYFNGPQGANVRLSYEFVSTPTPAPLPQGGAYAGNVGIGTTVTQSAQQELPKTGLPILAWLAVPLIPFGLKIRKFAKVKGTLEDSSNYLWEERQYKSKL